MHAPFVPAVTICALLLIGIIAALAWVSSRLAPHEPPYAPRHDRDRPFADPRDDTDPDGTQFVEQLTADEPKPQFLEELKELARSEDHLPRRQAKAAGARRPGTAPPLATVAQVLEGLRNLPVRPPVIASAPEFHPAPGCAEPDPDPADTGAIPAAVGTWGKTAAQLADELAAEHLGVRR